MPPSLTLLLEARECDEIIVELTPQFICPRLMHTDSNELQFGQDLACAVQRTVSDKSARDVPE